MISSVIDIGSNSIKMLVAEGTSANPIFETIRETRLSPNTDDARERIDKQAFKKGIESVTELFRLAKTYTPEKIAIVGTSLFRTAENAQDFTNAVFEATGTPMKILSGQEEATLVAAGVMTEPRLCAPCAIFDLGGGSLEFISCPEDKNAPVFETSWQLGAVRLTRKFLRDTHEAIPPEQISVLRDHVRKTVGEDLSKHLPRNTAVVFCGGAAGISAKLLKSLNRSEVNVLLEKACAGTLTERVKLGVPKERADIFPAALATFAEIFCLGKFETFIYTTRNLRYGLCALLNTAK